ncbi:MAG TPA: Ig-like domain-containing protein, partial [Thermomicrobiales bacterium]|nr:Ig-like domain-containing protein [Thermomicrobiales bacterium]
RVAGAAFELSVAAGADRGGPITAANGWHVVGDPTPASEIELQGPISATAYYPAVLNENIVAGNYIGTDITGTKPLGNGGDGVSIFSGAVNNVVGISDAGAQQANVIAFNAGAGVSVASYGSTGESIRGNSIHDNAGLGIDLGGDGVTANDSLDADAGSNNLQNFPIILATKPGAETRVVGTIDGAAESALVIDFYANASADPSGYGEGERHLGSTIATTDGAGHAAFAVTLLAATAPGELITATATDPAGDTSEFSAAVAVDDVPPQVLSIAPVSPDPRNAVVSSIDVTFSEPIDLGTLDAGDLEIAVDGNDEILNAAPLTFTPLNDTTVRVGGLDTLTGANGIYVVSVQGAGVQDVAGNAGAGV